MQCVQPLNMTMIRTTERVQFSFFKLISGRPAVGGHLPFPVPKGGGVLVLTIFIEFLKTDLFDDRFHFEINLKFLEREG